MSLEDYVERLNMSKYNKKIYYEILKKKFSHNIINERD